VVWDGFDNVSSSNIFLLKVALDFTGGLHGGGGQPHLARTTVHTPVLLVSEKFCVACGCELVLVPLTAQHGEGVVPIIADLGD